MNSESRPFVHTNLVITFSGLWCQFYLWTLTYITHGVCNFGNLDYIKQRILSASRDFADALRVYYGYRNADIFEALLKELFYISERLVGAVNLNDSEAIGQSITEWYQNADELAEFFVAINTNMITEQPYWSKQEWQNMLYQFLIILEDEIICHHNSQFDEDIHHYEELEKITTKLADYLAEGIIQQFNL